MELGNMMFGNSRGCVGVNRAMQAEWCSYMEEGGFDGYGYHDLSNDRGVFENDTFRLQPYYWGECECDYEARELAWCDANSHAAECYQTELHGRMSVWDIETGFKAIENKAFGRDNQDFMRGFDVSREETDFGVTVCAFMPRKDAAMDAWRRAHDKRQKFERKVMNELCAKYGLDRRFGCAVHCTCDYEERWRVFRTENDHATDCRIGTPNFLFKPTGFRLDWYKYPLRDSYSSEKLTPQLMRSMWAECLKSMAAQGIEARRAETLQDGSVHESPVAESDAPNPHQGTN